ADVGVVVDEYVNPALARARQQAAGVGDVIANVLDGVAGDGEADGVAREQAVAADVDDAGGVGDRAANAVEGVARDDGGRLAGLDVARRNAVLPLLGGVDERVVSDV